MAKTSHWYDQAAAVITRVRRQAEQLGLGEEATLALVDAAYPFGQRKHWPYQQWLKARRELLGLATPAGRAAAERAALDAWNAGAPLRAPAEEPFQ